MACRYFGQCGGCQLQHVPHEDQLAQKKDHIAKSAGIEPEVYAGEPWGYRNRMDFIFHPGGIGLRRKGKWDKILDVEECPIADPRINTLLREVRELKIQDTFNLAKKSGTFKYAVIRAVEGGTSISFILNADSSRLGSAIETIRSFAERTSADSVVVARVPAKLDESTGDDYFVVKGKDRLYERINGKEIHFPIQGFFQGNSETARMMTSYVRKLLEEHKVDTLLDLYGGVGTFGISCADMAGQVIIAEQSSPAVDAARFNASVHGHDNVTAKVTDAIRLRNLDVPTPFHAIVDPPRSGMHPRTVARLRVLAPDRIIHVSCNPKALRKEILTLRDYEVNRAAFFDQFPHTRHAEAVVELRHRA